MGSIASSEGRSGVSRRAALKAGVGLGVGVAAWTGPTITSLGGTPAYAAGCTFVTRIELIPCRNTDQGNCAKPTPNWQFAYHTLKNTAYPTGYSLLNNVSEGTCCTAGHTPVLKFPAGITCEVTIRIALPEQCTGTMIWEKEYSGSDGQAGLPIPLVCPPTNINVLPQSQYSIIAVCTTTGAPDHCFD